MKRIKGFILMKIQQSLIRKYDKLLKKMKKYEIGWYAEWYAEYAYFENKRSLKNE
jgi:hypothetical protein